MYPILLYQIYPSILPNLSKCLILDSVRVNNIVFHIFFAIHVRKYE